jgi:hypothetical protein
MLRYRSSADRRSKVRLAAPWYQKPKHCPIVLLLHEPRLYVVAVAQPNRDSQFGTCGQWRSKFDSDLVAHGYEFDVMTGVVDYLTAVWACDDIVSTDGAWECQR